MDNVMNQHEPSLANFGTQNTNTAVVPGVYISTTHNERDGERLGPVEVGPEGLPEDVHGAHVERHPRHHQRVQLPQRPHANPRRTAAAGAIASTLFSLLLLRLCEGLVRTGSSPCNGVFVHLLRCINRSTRPKRVGGEGRGGNEERGCTCMRRGVGRGWVRLFWESWGRESGGQREWAGVVSRAMRVKPASHARKGGGGRQAVFVSVLCLRTLRADRIVLVHD